MLILCANIAIIKELSLSLPLVLSVFRYFKQNMKRVIVISTSLRRGSNSDMLADKFVEGAKSTGNDV